MADLFNIQLRTGGHCNLGALSIHLNLSEEMMRKNFELGKICGDNIDLINGQPLGSVRISFGQASTYKDLDVFRKMLECCFVPSNICLYSNGENLRHFLPVYGYLTNIFIFPVKSCGGIQKKRWPICPMTDAFLYDRHWMIVSMRTREGLTQKQYPSISSIIPEIDLDDPNVLILKDQHGIHSSLHVPFNFLLTSTASTILPSKNYQNNEKILCCEDFSCKHLGAIHTFVDNAASKWLADFHPSLVDCGLVMIDQQMSKEGVIIRGKNFAKQGKFLLITRTSVEYIAMNLGLSVENVAKRFRPNLIVDFGPEWKPFQEEKIKKLSIGSVEFEVVGICRRCQMICIDQETGIRDPNVLIRLRDLRIGQSNSLAFGVYLEPIQNMNKEYEIVPIFNIQLELHVGSVACVLEYK